MRERSSNGQPPADRGPVPTKIHIIGDSGSGKSTLGKRLAEVLGVPFVELDALNWQPGWVALVDTDPQKFERRLQEATGGDGWVVVGNYMRYTLRTLWPRADMVIWLDLPRLLLVRRVIARSWRRYRTKELLWGSNYEPFWPQLMVWRKDKSLIWWIVTQKKRKRQQIVLLMSDPRWAHIRFVRLTSPLEIELWARRFEEHAGGAQAVTKQQLELSLRAAVRKPPPGEDVGA